MGLVLNLFGWIFITNSFSVFLLTSVFLELLINNFSILSFCRILKQKVKYPVAKNLFCKWDRLKCCTKHTIEMVCFGVICAAVSFLNNYSYHESHCFVGGRLQSSFSIFKNPKSYLCKMCKFFIGGVLLHCGRVSSDLLFNHWFCILYKNDSVLLWIVRSIRICSDLFLKKQVYYLMFIVGASAIFFILQLSCSLLAAFSLVFLARCFGLVRLVCLSLCHIPYLHTRMFVIELRLLYPMAICTFCVLAHVSFFFFFWYVHQMC